MLNKKIKILLIGTNNKGKLKEIRDLLPKNLDNFKKKFFNEFNEYPNYLSLLSYDLVGLIYYLSLNTDLTDINKLFKKKNSFKGKIGIFDIKDNKINHRLNLYKVEGGKLKEIF